MVRGHKKLVVALLATVLAGQCLLLKAQVAPTSTTSTLHWQPTLQEAQRIAAQTNRLVLVHFWSPSCGPCLQLEQNVFSQPQVQQAIEARFVPVKLNADDWPTTVKAFGVTRLPTDLIITPGAQIVGRMVSPPTPDSYLQQLAIAASGTGPAATPAGSMYAANAAGTAAPAAATTVAPSTVTPNSAPPSYGAPNQNYAASPAATPRYGALQPPAAAVQPSTQYNPATAVNPAEAAKPPAVAAYSDSRYSEYYQRFGVTPTPSAASNPVNPVSPAGSVSIPPSAPVIGAAAPAITPSYQSYQSSPNPYSVSNQYTPPTAAPSASMQAPPNVSAAAPPLGLEGYSPVALIDEQRWQLGDRRFGAIHRGRTYLFANPQEQQKFLSNPDHYSPVLSGHDAVVAVDYGQEAEGKRQYGVVYQGRIFLFSSEAAQRQFSQGQNAKRYAAEVMLAENSGATVTR